LAVEKAVRYSEAEGLDQVSFAAMKRALNEESLNLKIDERSVQAAQEAKDIVSRRKALGGTAPRALQENILSLSRGIQLLQKWLSQKRKHQFLAKTKLAEMERNL